MTLQLHCTETFTSFEIPQTHKSTHRDKQEQPFSILPAYGAVNGASERCVLKVSAELQSEQEVDLRL